VNVILKKNKKGFTLIELLVVIAIIAVLSTVILANLAKARSKARDAKRIAEFKQLQNALALYANNHNGTYPPDIQSFGFTVISPNAGGNPTCSNYVAGELDTYLNALVPTYIGQIPKEPTNRCYYYMTDDTGSFYKIEGPDIMENDFQANSPFVVSASPSLTDFITISSQLRSISIYSDNAHKNY
jgi:prepilin-type N-terminal cleavage/methylation domain-containing protein